MSTVCHHCGANLLPLSARCPACGNVSAPPVSWTAVTLAPEAANAASRAQRHRPVPKGAGDTSGGGVAPRPLGRRHVLRPALPDQAAARAWAGWAPSTRPGTTSWGSTSRIKVIRPDIIGEPAAAAEIQRRFKRELLLARQVSHKNVVRIHDLGEIEGIKYITMSYVDGTDLATLLKREGRLPVRAGPAHRPAHLRGAGGRARRRRGAPRPQAGQHHGRRRRRGADHRLRHRPARSGDRAARRRRDRPWRSPARASRSTCTTPT